MMEDDDELAEIEGQLEDILEEGSLKIPDKKTSKPDFKEDDLFSEEDEPQEEDMESLDDYEDLEDLENKHSHFDGESDDY